MNPYIDVGKYKPETITVNSLEIHVPRRPKNKQDLKEWRRLFRSCLRLAHAGLGTEFGYVIPRRPRVDDREWRRWYMMARRKSAIYKTLSKPKWKRKIRYSRKVNTVTPTTSLLLKILARQVDGYGVESIAGEFDLSYAAAKKLYTLSTKQGRHLLRNIYQGVLHRVRTTRLQDMELATLS